uniref:Uncharacterized protein n=1 Tax=Pseudictyota dubia TaxID=2749911 RepID=A0A7R9ZHD0_9STRA|mmetsp:Transcript_6183/g.10574  ORF Transcript_6183/g.10574 Transcript_6183/m.10574 type:complete len:144 (+) Transcript_6183:275-706(+)
MTNAYNDLALEDQEKLLMLPVGMNKTKEHDEKFCKGTFGMCHDEPGDPWWGAWNATMRDVFFFLRSDDQTTPSEFKYICHYSMDHHADEFERTLQDLLVVANKGGTVNKEDPEAKSSFHGGKTWTAAAFVGVLATSFLAAAGI